MIKGRDGPRARLDVVMIHRRELGFSIGEGGVGRPVLRNKFAVVDRRGGSGSGSAMVELEEAAESFEALDASLPHGRPVVDQFVVESLVVSLSVKMDRVRRHGATKRPRPRSEENKFIEAFQFDG